MTLAAHHIGKLDFRASVADLDHAMALRPRLEAFGWKLLPGAIERVADRLCPPDQHIRLGRLDIDLGIVRPDDLEADALAALERALADALSEAIHKAQISPSDQAQVFSLAAMRIELFEAYLVSGLVPLAGQGGHFDAAAQLLELAIEQPEALVAMLRQHGRDHHVLERLVLQAGETGLRALLSLLAPADAAVMLVLIADVLLAHREEAVARVPLAEAQLERVLWVATLEFLLRDAGSQFNRRRYLAFVLEREARRTGIAYAELLEMLGDAIARVRARTGFRSSLPVVLAELLSETRDPGKADTEKGGEDPFDAARRGNPAALLALIRSRIGDDAALSALVRRLDMVLFAGLVRKLEPAHAEQILGMLAELGTVRRAEALPVLPPSEFEERLRLLTLRYLVQDAGSQFNRRRFLGHLLEREALRARVDYATILSLLAGAVERVRTRTAIRSAMPAVLAELLAELKPVYAIETSEPEPGVEEATTAARSGDWTVLLRLLRERANDDAALTWLVRIVPDELFEGLVGELDSSQAATVIAAVAALIAQHRRQPLAALGDADFKTLVRRLALAVLMRGLTGRETMREVLRELAAAVNLPEASLLATLSRNDGLASLLQIGVEAQDLPKTAQALVEAAGKLDEAARRRWLAEIDAASAEAVEDELRVLTRAHASRPVLPLDAEAFGALIWALAVEWLRERHGRFDRRALARHLLTGLATRAGNTVAAVADEVRRGLRGSAATSRADASEVELLAREAARAEGGEDRRAAIAHYLRTGQPPSAGRGLPELARHDAAWLASLIRELASGTPSMMPALIERLLEWLLPEELVECLAPGSGQRASIWADSVGGGLSAWQPAVQGLIRGEAVPFAARRMGPGKRLDRLALIAHWLDHGTSAWWSRGVAPSALLADIDRLTLAELSWLFTASDPERSFARLWRAIEPLGGPARVRLIERLAPWSTDPNGPLTALLSEAGDDRRLEILVKAAAAGLHGDQLDIAAIGRSASMAMLVPTALPPPPAQSDDPERLFAWLDGAHAAPAERQALLRHFAKLADRKDRRLVAYLGARRGNAAAQMRWATVLPPEAIGRVVHLLMPAGARACVDAALTIGAAWRKTAPTGARRTDPARIWAMVLAAIAEPSVDLPRIVERLIEGLTRGDAAQARPLYAEAQRLAQGGGHVAVSAALRRAQQAPRATPITARPAAPKAETQKAPPADPDHPILIGNAGLVLLNPYLPVLFERLGLVTRSEEGSPRIEGVEAQSRAVHLLQFMADGRTNAPEPELALNKLLAGAAVAQPVEASIKATDAELETCTGLLRAVIGNWAIIGNTSIDGLRETFLQREGRLRRGDDRWDLHVQRKGLDVLIDQMPWTFSTIYHRWMAHPIHVTW